MSVNNPSKRQIKKSLDERIPRPDWKDSDARRKQVVEVAHKTISANPRSRAELTNIRGSKQDVVRKDLGVRKRTVMDKCGRQLYEEWGNVPNNKYHEEFDNMLWDIYQDLKT